MKNAAIIFSRMSSTRLPGKALMNLDGRCLLGRVFDRARLIDRVDHLILATSEDRSDDELASFAESEKVSVYRGNLTNVAERAVMACNEYKVSIFARICGDRPFFDPAVISQMFEFFERENVDLLTTNFPRIYPPGLTAEVINCKSLRRALVHSSNKEDQEHITTVFYRSPEIYRIVNMGSPLAVNFSDVNLTVDTEVDLKRAT